MAYAAMDGDLIDAAVTRGPIPTGTLPWESTPSDPTWRFPLQLVLWVSVHSLLLSVILGCSRKETDQGRAAFPQRERSSIVFLPARAIFHLLVSVGCRDLIGCSRDWLIDDSSLAVVGLLARGSFCPVHFNDPFGFRFLAWCGPLHCSCSWYAWRCRLLGPRGRVENSRFQKLRSIGWRSPLTIRCIWKPLRPCWGWRFLLRPPPNWLMFWTQISHAY